jgi:predicted ester cyclase
MHADASPHVTWGVGRRRRCLRENRRVKEGAKESLEGGWFAEHPTYRLSVDDIIGEGDKVAARLTSYEEGKPVGHSIVFYRLSDGKIVDDWFCSTQIQD